MQEVQSNLVSFVETDLKNSQKCDKQTFCFFHVQTGSGRVRHVATHIYINIHQRNENKQET